MITNLNDVTVAIESNGTGWRSEQIAGQEVWATRQTICANCGTELESQHKKDVNTHKFCSNCGKMILLTNQFSLSVPKEYNDYSTRKKPEPIQNNAFREMFMYIEHGKYRFDILKFTCRIDVEFSFTKNPHFIKEANRIKGINYDIGLRSLYKAEIKPVSTKINFVSCYSYDLNKKPGERMTLAINEPDNYIEINKKTIAEVYGTHRCHDIILTHSATTQWVRDNIYNATASKSLKNTLIAFQEPSLRLELAIKHGLSSYDIVIKNPTATKLHEILGISKACLKFATDKEKDKYSALENAYRTNYRKEIFELYHKVGDKYKEFFKDCEMFYNDSDVRFISGYQTKEKISYLYCIGYDMARLYTYLTEECKWQQGLQFSTALGELYDYVKMCEEMELRDYDRYPKALRTRHDVIAMRYNSVKMNKEEAKNFNDVVKKYKKLEYKTTKYLLKIAQSPKELVQEGQELNHCVGSYADRMANESNVIFFMRSVDNPDKALVTIEIMKEGNALDGFKIRLGQCKGSFNRGLSTEERNFINQFKKTVLSKAIIDDMGNVILIKPEKDADVNIKEREQALLENNDTIVIEDDELLTAIAN